ncbi:MAG: hypothetical protein A3H96_05820 [Acidobacteria bacterium RIFCSPLOWO2_02_FULL_67_36]|nr:MAG: hypothetical protein A3H96_05820 [Acidobacteria bacterium RIFCSPLOWO2_02_FULL_67_36]OFW19770.1 MAG: hypothetical protein A3G21_13400 [Acidobacteria bacterium RIFCSPLOWO2_12_FULL_66_21]
MQRLTLVVLSAALLSAPSAAAQQVRYDDVIRNLRNPDEKIRLAAVRLLRESKYPEAVEPIAPLVVDPVDQIQLEAIAAELSFFLVEDIPAKRRVALVVEVRNPGTAAAAFEKGPLAVWPRPVPPALVSSLLHAIDDENAKVRNEAIWTLGAIARPPLGDPAPAQLIKALDHYDPAIRAAAAAVIGRLEVRQAGDALLKAVNDSDADVRYAAMRALGAIRERRAVQALAEQFNFYVKGEGAWSALDALARIGDAASVPLFKTNLRSKDPFLRRAAAEGLGRTGDTSEIPALEIGAGNDPSEMVRAAMEFALQKLGRNYVPRLADALGREKMAPQIAGYFMELGPSIVPALLAHLQDPSPAIRGNVAQIVGVIGGPDAVAALQPLTQDRNKEVAEAATRAIERIKMKG